MVVEMVGVKKITEKATIPQYHSSGAAGFDLAIDDEAVIPPRSLILLSTGLVFDVPEGYFLAIVARSSTPKRGLMVANSIGVLDSDYNGPNDEAKILVYNFTDQPVRLEVGDRIAQGLILPVVNAMFVPFDHPEDATSRGGFGSTGM